jgi:protein-S-isoprenylcysteine O-methyltransferase Ste14
MLSLLPAGSDSLTRVLVADLLLAAWGIAEWLVRARAHAREGSESPGVSKDRGSFAPIVLCLAAAVVAPFLFLTYAVGPLLPAWVGLAGAALVITGICVREWALLVLGRFFSVMVIIRADHEIVREGPYKRVRHPSYTGLLLIAIGTSVLIGPVFGVLLAFGATLAALIFRIHVEEQALLERFGNEYAGYRETTWRLLPGIY